MSNYNYDKIREQIIAVRDIVNCNMFDARAVQRAANDNHFYDLVIFIEEQKERYTHFILTGSFD